MILNKNPQGCKCDPDKCKHKKNREIRSLGRTTYKSVNLKDTALGVKLDQQQEALRTPQTKPNTVTTHG